MAEVENENVPPSVVEEVFKDTRVTIRRIIQRDVKAHWLLRDPDNSWYAHGYETLEWILSGVTTATEYEFPRVSDTSVFIEGLTRVGESTIDVPVSSKQEYARRLIELMQDPPHNAEFFFEASRYPILAPRRPLMQALEFIWRKEPEIIGYTHAIYFLKRRHIPMLPPPDNVLVFSQQKRRKKV